MWANYFRADSIVSSLATSRSSKMCLVREKFLFSLHLAQYLLHSSSPKIRYSKKFLIVKGITIGVGV